MAHFIMPQTQYARSGDINIAYHVIGDGPIDLMIIPGAISHIELILELPGVIDNVLRLARFARIITFDKRGVGLSDRVPGVPSLEERVDDIRAVLDAVGSRKTALLGFSEGSAMSLLFSATYPDRVSHLVLAGGFIRAGYSVPEAQFEAIADQIVAGWGSGQMMKRVVGITEGTKEQLAALGKFERMSCSPGAFKAVMVMNRRIDVEPILQSVRVPTLLLHSKMDAVVPVAEGRKLAHAIVGAKYVEYDNLPHGLLLTPGCEEVMDDIEEFVTGHRPDISDDVGRVLATVLFTDIVNSTTRAIELGDRRWRALLDTHDRLAAQVVEKHRGKIVKNTGDGILAMFDGPGRGVRCALALGEAAQQIGLPIRAGLHTGEVEMRGDDVGGIAVHVAARIMGQSGENEVFVSRVVTDLVAGAGLTFTNRGSFDLKGLPGHWDLFAAVQ
ncbi:adenylate/guanylate cyclase domain-containing protein [Bradyrhizobium sp. CCBAU 53338]|uniref:adenylate/guanylate cyclase domain-containing protein n=1 Tax=Bradyrhizobium sp. CCBAU 53338 TaxID=1325111 RepID=UPI00188B6D88|nr:adenylate/guanylate cyclase domain-containing protein [Bradyrhizobium sp. CCBAU 53338]QOZ54445.1 adenylate/guanylate cyclase domain-containing protein [Bradyrhizobium sp. CCBAU 53338]